MIFLLDNYDSFTYNLFHCLAQLGSRIEVARNREISVDEVLALRPEAIVLSPGPGRPADAGILPQLVKAAAGRIPLLGVCLGHQAIGEAFGMRLDYAREVVHGKVSMIRHDGRGLFKGLGEAPFGAVRYHSLALVEETLPADFEVTCRTEDGEVMGIRHKSLPIEGIQYHPESILTASGKRQLGNFIALAEEFRRK